MRCTGCTRLLTPFEERAVNEYGEREYLCAQCRIEIDDLIQISDIRDNDFLIDFEYDGQWPDDFLGDFGYHIDKDEDE